MCVSGFAHIVWGGRFELLRQNFVNMAIVCLQKHFSCKNQSHRACYGLSILYIRWRAMKNVSPGILRPWVKRKWLVYSKLGSQLARQWAPDGIVNDSVKRHNFLFILAKNIQLVTSDPTVF